MVTAIRFADVPVSVVQLPLAASGTGIIPRSRLRIHAKLRHQPSANVVVVKIAADSDLRELDFVRSEDFARTADRMIARMIERVMISRIESDLSGEDLAVDPRFFCAGVAGQPGEVRERERLGASRLRS